MSVLQGHNAELQRLQGLLAQQDKEASARQERIASPALEQLADTSSWVPSLTMDGLKDLLDGLKDSGKSSSPSQAAPSTLAQQGQPNKGTWVSAHQSLPLHSLGSLRKLIGMLKSPPAAELIPTLCSHR